MSSSSTSPNMLELLFDLNVEDGWPPVAAEGLPATPLQDGYRVEAAPLFIKDISVGDVISVTRTAAGHVATWKHVLRSGRTTVWLLRLKDTDEIDNVLTKLRSLGCNTNRLPQFGCYSIDVPENCPIGNVDDCLETFDPTVVAVVYPSFRHPEP